MKNALLYTNIALAAMLLISCENETLDINSPTTSPELEALGQDWEKISYNGKTIDVQKEGNFYIWGDMLIPISAASQVSNSDQTNSSVLEGENTQNQSITSDSEKIWSNNTVPYYFDPSYRNPTIARAAIHHWELFTTIDFVETEGEADTDLLIFQGSSCNATVGFNNAGRHTNSVSIGTGCTLGNAVHEFGHAVGLHHEQTRNDRDDHVNVFYENIIPAFHSQFDKNEDTDRGSLEFTPFDFESVMMYASDAFSIEGIRNSMLKLDGTTISSSGILSKYDVSGIESIYNQGSPKTIAISSLINGGDYISSENGRKDITSTREAIGRWERFTVISFGGGEISLQASNGRFLSVNSETGGLKFSSRRIGDNEKFIATYNTTFNDKFYYTISHNSSELFANDSTGELRIDNSGGGGQDTLFSIEILE